MKKISLKGVIPLATAFVMVVPTVNYAASSSYSQQIGSKFNSILTKLGIVEPRQDTCTAYIDTDIKIDGENYRTRYSVGEELIIKIAFTDKILSYSDDTNIVIKFGENGVERVIKPLEIDYDEGQNYIEFSYFIQNGDNGGLIICNLEGEVFYDEGIENMIVIAKPNDPAMYKNTIIADTVKSKLNTDENKIISSEKLYVYTPGDYIDEYDKREEGIISELKAEDIKVITSKYEVIAGINEGIDYILNEDNEFVTNIPEDYDGVKYNFYKLSGDTLFIKSSEDKYYMLIADKEDVNNFIDITNYIEDYESTKAINLTELFNDNDFINNNFIFAKDTLKNNNDIKIAKVKEITKNVEYQWKTYINNIECLETKDNSDINEDFVLENIKDYYNYGENESYVVKSDRIKELNDEELTKEEVLVNKNVLFFDIMKQVEVGGKKYTAYYNSTHSTLEPMMYEDEQGNKFLIGNDEAKTLYDITEYFYVVNNDQPYIDLTDIINSRDEKYNDAMTYLNEISGSVYCDNIDVRYYHYKLDISNLYDGDKICIPNLIDKAGNVTDCHLNANVNDSDITLTLLEDVMEPIIDVSAEGNKIEGYTYINSGKKITIKALSSYKDGAIKVGFRVHDYDEATFKDAKYVSYDGGVCTWEYEVEDGDQGVLYVKIDKCACNTIVDLEEPDPDEEDTIENEVKFDTYIVDTIAPVIYNSSVKTNTTASLGYSMESQLSTPFSYKTIHEDDDEGVIKYIWTDKGDDKGECLLINANIIDETKMNTELSSKSYTSDENNVYDFEDVYTSSTAFYKYDKDGNIEYDISGNPIYEKYKTNTVYETDKDGNYVYRNDDGEIVESALEGHKTIVGEYISYKVDSFFVNEGLSIPVINVTDCAGNEANYIFNADAEGGQGKFVLMADDSSPTIEIAECAENTQDFTFDLKLRITDPNIAENVYGSGIMNRYNEDGIKITNGTLVDYIEYSPTIEDNEKVAYIKLKIMPEANGYTKIYIRSKTFMDNVYNYSNDIITKQVYTDMVSNESVKINDIVGVPTNWAKDATISVIASDAGEDELLYYFEFTPTNSETTTEQEYSDNNKFYVSENGVLEIKVKDKHNREISRTIEIDKIDNVAPTISDIDVTNVSDTEVQVSINAIDNESGLAEYSFDGGESWQTTPTKSYSETTVIEANSLMVKDNVGNISQYEETVNAELTTARIPVVKVNELMQYYTIPTGGTKSSVYLNMEADADHPCQFGYIYTDQKYTTSEELSELDFTISEGINTTRELLELSEGQWYIYFYAEDMITGAHSGYYYYKNPITIGKSKITLTPSTTELTTGSVNVYVNYGQGLTENRWAGVDNSREANLTNVKVTKNGTVYAEATDTAGNKVYTSISIGNIKGGAIAGEQYAKFDIESDDSPIQKIVIVKGCNYIYLKEGTTLNSINDYIDATGDVILSNSDKTVQYANDEIVKTGGKVTFSDISDEYTIVVKGDVNSDGKVNMLDILKTNKARINTVSLQDEETLAADVTEDEVINMSDILKINKYRLGKISKL